MRRKKVWNLIFQRIRNLHFVWKIKVLVLDSGLFQKDVFYSHQTQLLPVSKVRLHHLLRADVVIVPFHVDQYALNQLHNAFQKFLKNGGVLVLLGVTQYIKWLPYGDWDAEYPKNCVIVKKFKDDPIFKNLTSEKLKYHAIYSGHGSLSLRHLLDQQNEAEILVEAENKQTIMYRWKLPKGGWLLATTLDPDHHAANGTPGPGKTINRGNSEAQRNAAILLNNIVNWSINMSKNRRLILRLWAQFKGIFLNVFIFCSLYIALIIITLALMKTVCPSDVACNGQTYAYTYFGVMAIVISFLQFADYVKTIVKHGIMEVTNCKSPH